MEQCVILDGRDRQFNEVADKEGHNGAAAVRLQIKSPDAGYRHVIVELQILKPFLVSVQRAGAEPGRRELRRVGIYPLHATLKGLSIVKSAAIMVQIMNVYFKAAGADAFKEALGDVVTLFRHDLK